MSAVHIDRSRHLFTSLAANVMKLRALSEWIRANLMLRQALRRTPLSYRIALAGIALVLVLAFNALIALQSSQTVFDEQERLRSGLTAQRRLDLIVSFVKDVEIGVRAREMALPSDGGAWPHPSQTSSRTGGVFTRVAPVAKARDERPPAKGGEGGARDRRRRA